MLVHLTPARDRTPAWNTSACCAGRCARPGGQNAMFLRGRHLHPPGCAVVPPQRSVPPGRLLLSVRRLPPMSLGRGWSTHATPPLPPQRQVPCCATCTRVCADTAHQGGWRGLPLLEILYEIHALGEVSGGRRALRRGELIQLGETHWRLAETLRYGAVLSRPIHGGRESQKSV